MQHTHAAWVVMIGISLLTGWRLSTAMLVPAKADRIAAREEEQRLEARATSIRAAIEQGSRISESSLPEQAWVGQLLEHLASHLDQLGATDRSMTSEPSSHAGELVITPIVLTFTSSLEATALLLDHLAKQEHPIRVTRLTIDRPPTKTSGKLSTTLRVLLFTAPSGATS